MARRTALEMVNEVAANIGDVEHLQIPQAAILRHLNDAATEIAIMHEPSECINTVVFLTVAGQRDYADGDDYTIPPERPLLKMLSLFNMTNNFRLLEVDDTWYRVTNAGGTISGTPTHWYNLADVGYIRLFPEPDNVYSMAIAYLHRPFELVLDPVPNVSRLNVAWDEVQVALATARAFRRLQNWQAAEQWAKDAISMAARTRAAITTLNAEPWPVGSINTWGKF